MASNDSFMKCAMMDEFEGEKWLEDTTSWNPESLMIFVTIDLLPGRNSPQA